MKICEHLEKHFDEKIIFSDFSFDIPQGIVAILGPSGCGKTTLFRLLLDLVKPDSGNCIIFRPAGVVFPEFRLIEWLSPLENIRLVCPKVSREEIFSVLRLLEIDINHQRVSQLSSGQKQRVAFARAWLFDSPWLLLDEAFRSWDIGLKQRIFPLFRNQWKEKKTLTLFITHDLTEALMLADHLVVFSFPPVRILEETSIELQNEERTLLTPEHPLFKQLRRKISHHFDPLRLISQSQR